MVEIRDNLSSVCALFWASIVINTDKCLHASIIEVSLIRLILVNGHLNRLPSSSNYCHWERQDNRSDRSSTSRSRSIGGGEEDLEIACSIEFNGILILIVILSLNSPECSSSRGHVWLNPDLISERV